jgi:hypothetical protein
MGALADPKFHWNVFAFNSRHHDGEDLHTGGMYGVRKVEITMPNKRTESDRVECNSQSSPHLRALLFNAFEISSRKPTSKRVLSNSCISHDSDAVRKRSPSSSLSGLQVEGRARYQRW